MISVPAVLWQVDTGVYFFDKYGGFLPVLNGFLSVAALGLLLATAFSDPGIVPRQESFMEQYDVRTKTFRMKQPARWFDITLRGYTWKLKYCSTCFVYRPPRCTHCSVCENCVERFDHHCPWIGNCVGRRNYWLFYLFVSSTGMMNVTSLATSLVKMINRINHHKDVNGKSGGDAFLKTMQDAPITTALVVYSTALVWFTMGLCIYHTYLLFTNQTTYEQVKGTYSDGRNPFNRGVIRNFQDGLCSPVRRRLFDARKGILRWPAVDAKSSARALKVAVNE